MFVRACVCVCVRAHACVSVLCTCARTCTRTEIVCNKRYQQSTHGMVAQVRVSQWMSQGARVNGCHVCHVSQSLRADSCDGSAGAAGDEQDLHTDQNAAGVACNRDSLPPSLAMTYAYCVCV